MTLSEALASLGSTEAEVVETLRKAGVTGARKSACGCPVAIYIGLKSNLHMVTTSAGPSMCTLDSQRSKTPVPVRDFINSFDAGRYPELEET